MDAVQRQMQTAIQWLHNWATTADARLTHWDYRLRFLEDFERQLHGEDGVQRAGQVITLDKAAVQKAADSADEVEIVMMVNGRRVQYRVKGKPVA